MFLPFDKNISYVGNWFWWEKEIQVRRKLGRMSRYSVCAGVKHLMMSKTDWRSTKSQSGSGLWCGRAAPSQVTISRAVLCAHCHPCFVSANPLAFGWVNWDLETLPASPDFSCTFTFGKTKSNGDVVLCLTWGRVRVAIHTTSMLSSDDKAGERVSVSWSTSVVPIHVGPPSNPCLPEYWQGCVACLVSGL